MPAPATREITNLWGPLQCSGPNCDPHQHGHHDQKYRAKRDGSAEEHEDQRQKERCSGEGSQANASCVSAGYDGRPTVPLDDDHGRLLHNRRLTACVVATMLECEGPRKPTAVGPSPEA